jgi:hypothetical protein
MSSAFITKLFDSNLFMNLFMHLFMHLFNLIGLVVCYNIDSVNVHNSIKLIK